MWLSCAAGIVLFTLWFFGLERNLAAYARLCEGEERSYYDQVREITFAPEAESVGYAYYINTPLPAKTAPSWFSRINVVDEGPYLNPSHPYRYNRRPNSVYGYRFKGVLYLTLFKSRNFAAGICVPVLPSSTPMQSRQFTLKSIPDSKWMIWKLNLEV